MLEEEMVKETKRKRKLKERNLVVKKLANLLNVAFPFYCAIIWDMYWSRTQKIPGVPVFGTEHNREQAKQLLNQPVIPTVQAQGTTGSEVPQQLLGFCACISQNPSNMQAWSCTHMKPSKNETFSYFLQETKIQRRWRLCSPLSAWLVNY